jgi:hypothetical protein
MSKKCFLKCKIVFLMAPEFLYNNDIYRDSDAYAMHRYGLVRQLNYYTDYIKYLI